MGSTPGATKLEAEKKFSEGFYPHVYKLFPWWRFIRHGTPEEDMKRVCDIQIDGLKLVHGVAVRIRRMKYFPRYRDDMTMRWPAEIAKVLRDGYGSYYFYGFGENRHVHHYSVLDLDVVRELWGSTRDKFFGERKKNGDGTQFHPFFYGKAAKVRPDLVIASNICEVQPTLF